jgi:UDP-N-acetylglucosamine--N-acetylmuramyl-(pentapeptide) pyrophosphoryl-undecaprenol N-acetylglucosamine transferase
VKILIAGGGTGGHFFSGVAVGEAFLARDPGARVVYVGTRNGIEGRLGDEFDIRFIDVAGIKGKGLGARLRGLLKLPRSLFQSLRLILKEKPDVVMGVGGYASGPVVLVARLLGKPTGIVEQNSVAGATNALLGKFVHRVFLAFEEAAPAFPRHKVVVTGNPIRERVVQLLTLESTGTVGLGARFKLLVLGGSQGARAINEAMMGLAAAITPEFKERLHVVHQTGTDDEERVRAAYAEGGIDAEVHAFIQGMAEAYRAADLVLCRAGALTVSELSMSSRGSLLVPFPHAIYNHQELNARALVEAGAGLMLLERDMTPESLAAGLQRLAADRKALQHMAFKAGTLARPEAATEVVDEMYRVLGVP